MDIFRRRFYNDRDPVRKVAYVSNQFIKLVPPPPGLATGKSHFTAKTVHTCSEVRETTNNLMRSSESKKSTTIIGHLIDLHRFDDVGKMALLWKPSFVFFNINCQF